MIRKAVPDDVTEIVELAMKALQENAYPELVISREKVRAVARECVSAAQHFAMVAVRDGRVAGAVIAMSVPMMFYERNQAQVLMFYCRQAPGEGIAMLRELVRWFRSRPVLKMLEFTLEPGADPRIGKLLQRLGLGLSLPIYVAMR